MQQILDALSKLQLHPVADHFTIALLMVAVLTDLAASAAPMRSWIRYMALVLLVLGALAAGGSYFTGGWEADRVWDAVTDPAAKGVLNRHAELGEWLAVSFAVLAIWRIGIESIGFIARSRPLYLIVAIVAAVTLGYQGHIGGELVYDYGVGTALMASPSPSPSPLPSAAATATPLATPAGPLPTVYNPVPTPAATLTPATPTATRPSASPTSTGGAV